jgi:two-component sensor histidine kinase
MTESDIGICGVLAALPEPAMLADGRGVLLFANGPAVLRLGLAAEDLPGFKLASLCDTPEDEQALSSLLRRTSGTTSILPGALTLRTADGGTHRFRCQSSRIGVAGGPRIFVRLTEDGDQRFTELNRKISELHDEVRQRRSLQARLEEALSERELLVRELHHRVKNNLQTIVGLLHAAEREGGKEPFTVLHEVSRRLSAAGAVHQLLHHEETVHGVRGAAFLNHLCTLIAKSLGVEEHFSVTSTASEVSNDAAMPLALILNELLTNAVKHGSVSGALTPVHASLIELAPGAMELTVEDGGPGFPPSMSGTGRRASGLGLVRGLARQLGGTVALEQSALGGARCSVRFRSTRLETPPQARS